MKIHLLCPHCGRRIIDMDDRVRNEIRVLQQKDRWKPDYYLKCWKCSSRIGVKLIDRRA